MYISSGIRVAARMATILAALFVQVAGADTVSLKLENGIRANADFRPGDPGKPALLLLHGFLQTYNFHTIFSLSGALNDEGYTTLAPTLSLNVPNRRKSLACEAIHTHTLEGDLSEVRQWIDWLGRQGHDSVILVGHSTGSMTLLAYLEQERDPRVKDFIGISIVESRMESSVEQQAVLREDLRRRIERGDRSLVRHQFSFCKPMLAAPDSLLSYMVWTPDRILQAIRNTETPQFFIMGSLDNRLGADWIERLGETGKPVVIIYGANHFMGGEYEFALSDVILDRLP